MRALHDDDGVRLITRLRQEDGALLCRPSEMYMVYSLARAQAVLEGDFAEVGVYQGATARLICEAKGAKTLHLFDTFEGLPGAEAIDVAFSQRMFAASEEGVRARLAGFDGVHIHKGLFPDTAGPIRDLSFAFVNLDVDIYQSTRDALEFFYPRLVPGGVLISHDHPTAPGVVRAFVEVLSDKPEAVIQLPLSQGMIVKRAPSG